MLIVLCNLAEEYGHAGSSEDDARVQGSAVDIARIAGEESIRAEQDGGAGLVKSMMVDAERWGFINSSSRSGGDGEGADHSGGDHVGDGNSGGDH